jgi:peptide-methionine (S)-S-oxide reductase
MTVRSLVACAALLALPIDARGAMGQRVMHPDEGATPRVETIVLSGGCYWTMEAVFEHVRGVTDVVSGIAGREAGAAAYARNPSGTVGLAEAVRITYDPEVVSLAELLHVFAAVAHDPTLVNRQGPDIGPRYRSVIWTSNDSQRRTAMELVARLEREGRRSVATQVATLADFRPVVESEQDFVAKNPEHPYVIEWDRPKLERFRRVLPELYRERVGRE